MNSKGNKVIIATIAFVLVVILGLIGWQIFASDDSGSNNVTETNTPAEEENEEVEEEPQVDEGTISGSLTYPSEQIPEDMEIHAYNIDTQHDYFIKDHINDSKYQHGVGYELSVPVGTYHVYGMSQNIAGHKAYYNEFVRCGMAAECTDLAPIEVVVEKDKTTEDITIGDWYNI